MATTLTSSGNQPKKLVIKGLKVQPKLPENFEEETWVKLQEAIRAIQTNNKTTTSLEELYKATEDLCLHKLGPKVYNRLQTECENHIKSESLKLIGQTPDPYEYLILVNKLWDAHCKHMIDIRSVLLYLDRTYVLQSSAVVLSIWDLGLSLFRQYVMSHEEILRKTVHSFLYLVEKEREGDSVNRSLLKSLSRMFSSLQMYTDHLERPFLDATKSFYMLESQNKIREVETAEYLRHVEKRIHEESNRVLQYLDTFTKNQLIAILDAHLIQNQVDTICKGFTALAKEDRFDDIRRMYNLLSRVSALEKLKDTWKLYIKGRGSELVNFDGATSSEKEEKEKVFVQDLLNFKQHCDTVLETPFHKNESFGYALKESFEAFINSYPNKPAELIAKFVDSKLKTAKKGLSEEDLELLLDKIIVLFRCIHGKDVFEAFYKKDLAKRLLLGKSISMDAEKSMISKLKSECGASFTNKLEGMFKDIDISKDILKSFKDSQFYDTSSGVEMHVHVLTQGFWPAYPQVDVNLPALLGQHQEFFKKFYLSKHNGRRISFQNTLASCTLRANFPSAKKELMVTLFQSVVLLLFNDSDTLKYTELKASSGLDDKELKRTLQSLCVPKLKILIKNPKSSDINPEDQFTYNREFRYKLYRIKVNTIQTKETVEENQKTTATVMQDRQYQIDAAIVRIMKTRKVLPHVKLVNEVLSQLKFDIKGADIKKRIESLIEREYLERDKEAADVYKYLA